MKKVRLFFSNLLLLIGRPIKERPNILQVIFHFNPSFEILADYYDLSWLPREGAMFGRSYPLRYVVHAIHEAVEYARSNGYNLLQVDTAEFGQSPKTFETIAIH